MRGVAFVTAAFVTTLAGLARGEPAAGLRRDSNLSSGVARTPAPTEGPYVHTFGELMLGKGLRLNNPFRLATPVGDEPDGLSFTAYYLDLGIGAALGPPTGLQHGGEVSLSIATDGIAQQVMSLSYVALYPITPQVLVPWTRRDAHRVRAGRQRRHGARRGRRLALYRRARRERGARRKSVLRRRDRREIVDRSSGDFARNRCLVRPRGAPMTWGRKPFRSGVVRLAFAVVVSALRGADAGRHRGLRSERSAARSGTVLRAKRKKSIAGSAANARSRRRSARALVTRTKNCRRHFPEGCDPIVHDGEVCLNALEAAGCGDYEAYVKDGEDRQAPNECRFCPVEP